VIGSTLFLFSCPEECPVVKKYRIIVNVPAGTATPHMAEAVEIDGRHYTRQLDGTLRPLEVDAATAAGDYIASGWLDDQAAAYGQAAEEIDRQIHALATLRLVCMAGMEVIHV
jgi:hypothetical protein